MRLSFKLHHRINIEYTLIIIPFFLVSILYYFLRFQFDLDFFILSIYSILQILIIGIVPFKVIKTNNFKRSFIDSIMLFVSLHFIYLLIFTLLRNFSSNTLLYAIKDYFFPICFYWYIRLSIFKKYLKMLLNFIFFLSFTASIIYLLDFYLKGIMGEPSLIYLEKIRNLTMEKSEATSLSGTIVKGDLFNLFRFEGPLGHNSATSLFISIGVTIGIFRNLFVKNYSYLFFLTICFIALIVSANRTSIFALILSMLIHLSIYKYNSLNGYRIIKYSTFFVIFLNIVFLFLADNPFGFIFSFESLQRNLDYILFSNKEFVQLMPFFYNPILWFGVGFPIIDSDSFFIDIIRSDDFFLIQLVSIYGILFIVFLFIFFRSWYINFKVVNIKLIIQDKYIMYSYSSIVIIMLVSILHAGSLTRPQLFPLFFASLAALSVVLNSYRK